ncbi:MAG: inverse autotransporter beta domain-containing protein, partial [Deltaproteobacteria bacterium]|nr:inverse autotransporter beta domain-containing protein [Deltaproteobacteria bacterium]
MKESVKSFFVIAFVSFAIMIMFSGFGSSASIPKRDKDLKVSNEPVNLSQALGKKRFQNNTSSLDFQKDQGIFPPTESNSLYRLVARNELHFGMPGNLTLELSKNGIPVPRGTNIKLIPNSQWPNIRPITRQTLGDGTITLRGVLARGGPGNVLLLGEVDHQDIRALVSVLENTLTLKAKTTPSTFSDRQKTYNSQINFFVNGKPLSPGSVVEFLQNPDLPNLRSLKRHSGRNGEIFLTGLRILNGDAKISARVNETLYAEGPLFSQNHLQNEGAFENLENPGTVSSSYHKKRQTYHSTMERVRRTKEHDITGPSLINSEINQELGQISSAFQNTLAPYGNTQISLGLDYNYHLRGAMDFLYPFYESEKVTSFAQARFNYGDTVLLNLGVGTRYLWDENTLFGVNLFGDLDVLRHHSRVGLGVEFWKDYLRISANIYEPLSSFKPSRDYWGALERPARGYDLRAKGFLPFYDKVALTLNYENFRGTHVEGLDLFQNPQNTKKSHNFVTVGVMYSPIPALTFQAEQRFGQGKSSPRFMVLFNPSLTGSNAIGVNPSQNRHSFVDRNYDMPLEYKAQDSYLISLIQKDGEVYYYLIKNSLNIPWANTHVLVRPDTSGFTVHDVQTRAKNNSFVTNREGVIRVLYLSEDNIEAGQVTLMVGGISRKFPLTFAAKTPVEPEPEEPIEPEEPEEPVEPE